ncbi:hypothetical protein C5167_024252 [Papaver somniferum]|uniref:Uncharacterized protein n=1 Tax=Papaver somniferum TaxID=3469 RepID=A0A4Y7JR27_PAPSO|nr:hypothetical protein C5167_024252 [Papaver somniferum]
MEKLLLEPQSSEPYQLPSVGRLTLSLGLETSGGVMVKVIHKYHWLPDTVSTIFSTIADGQTSIVIHVLQGESEFMEDNKSLGSFRINGICPAPRGVPQIEVEFNIDEDGILSVAAFDEGTGNKLDITLTGGRTLTNVGLLLKYYELMMSTAEKYQIMYEYDTIKRKLSQFI